jgi:hypothetical protein
VTSTGNRVSVGYRVTVTWSFCWCTGCQNCILEFRSEAKVKKKKKTQERKKKKMMIIMKSPLCTFI